ncbi:MAG TPA: VWA domain-containing protein [Vicinamibacteria bacterium]|nr:VWA domain-containing protein [Vicinamibacteria bacterium]
MSHSVSERRRRRATRFSVPPFPRCLIVGSLSLLLSGIAQSRDDTRIDVSLAGSRGGTPSVVQTTSEARPTFRSTTKTVLLQVSVLDKDGTPVGDLRRQDFVVYEDGVPQEITYFEHGAAADTVPTGIVLLVDTSSSMKGVELLEAKGAALRFLDETPSQAEIAIVGFDDETKVVQDFTRDRNTLMESVHRLAPGGGTALYDGILQALELLGSSSSRRQVLVVLSDGKDLDSVTQFGELRQRIESSPAVVYALGYYSQHDRQIYVDAKNHSEKHYKNPPLDSNLNPAWVLREVAAVSGGTAYFPRESAELAPLFIEIARGMRLQYVIAYSPASADDGEPRFRKIEVRAMGAPPQAQPLTVRSRRGYVR